MEKIMGFQGRYRFLSNFYPSTVEFEDRIYKSSEAAYQAAKSPHKQVKDGFTSIDAREARKLGRRIAIRLDWEADKLNVMYRVLRVKFSGEPLRSMLITTEDQYLEETNYWHDTFWGVYNGEGLNHLGRLLMLVRDELREGII